MIKMYEQNDQTELPNDHKEVPSDQKELSNEQRTSERSKVVAK
jgi:hypothetical protein